MSAAPPADAVERLLRDGYAVIHDAIAPDLRRRAHAAACRLLATDRVIGRDRGSDGKDGFRGVHAMDDAFLPFVANPGVLHSVLGVLGTDIHLMSSHLISLPSVPHGATRTIRVPARHGWHRDMGAATRALGHAAIPRLAVKAAYFLTEPEPNAGVTMLLPGSHTRTTAVDVPVGAIDPDGAITPALGPCDAVLFENRTWHAGGLNSSGRPRIALMMQYGYRWLARLDDPAPQLLGRTDLTAIERQLLGQQDRNPDGTVAAEGAGAEPLRAWQQHLRATSPRSPHST